MAEWVRRFGLVAAAGVGLACGPPASPTLGPIFIDGRSTAPAGDSLLGATVEGLSGILTINLDTETWDTLAAETLVGPVNLQYLGRRWYVSNGGEGAPRLTVLTATGTVERHIPLPDIVSDNRQFAALPGGALIVETRDGRLIDINADTVTTFALVEVGNRSGLVAGVSGGVLHGVHDKHLTLYNEFGNIRWRVEWPWASAAYVTAIAVDRSNRIHILAGDPTARTFRVYTVGRTDGEIIQWSHPSDHATFTVTRRGNYGIDRMEVWLGLE